MDFSKIDENDSATEGTDFRPEPPDMVAGRVLHADADFYAYMCGYRWEEESLEASYKALRQTIHTARIMAGAEFIKLYLTMGDKGGRYEIAKVKEYQGKRENAPGLDARVSELRHWMANCSDSEVFPAVFTDQEADDGICQAMWEAVKTASVLQNPMWSMDKDLYMAPGLHMNPVTYELEMYPEGFGECYLDESTSQKKVVGKGTSFFWHQMLMGDSADGIPGLPKFSADICERLWPTKALLIAEKRIRTAKTTKAKVAAKAAVRKQRDSIKPKLAGPVKAFDYLKDCKTDLDCFKAVREAYLEHYGHGEFKFTDWRGDEQWLTAGDMLLEQAELLWMRRTKDDRVLDFFKEIAA